MKWEAFFPAGTPVLALPSWERPRLFVAAWGVRSRWDGSALYPAFRWTARAFRQLLRVKAALRAGRVRWARGEWVLESFIRRAGCKEVIPWAVFFGTKGPAQKVTVELRTRDGEIVGYVKYGEADAAQRRISQEYSVLKALPLGFAPKPLYFGPVGCGLALLLSAVRGRRLGVSSSLHQNVVRYSASLPVSGFCRAEAHPWITQLVTRGSENVHKWLWALGSREWAVMPQHGDFAPWNLLQDDGGRVRAIDWEYGTLQGFPGTDLAYYMLQVGALIHQWSPDKARAHTMHVLTRLWWPGLSLREAEALTRLTAYDAYIKALEDGHSPHDFLQVWRRAVWGES